MKFADKISLTKMLEEMAQLGIDNMQNYVAGPSNQVNMCLLGEASLSIGSSTVAFAKTWLHFVKTSCN
ncbi:hypothetical protein Ocin01_13112, partial [Orchesella cincta]